MLGMLLAAGVITDAVSSGFGAFTVPDDRIAVAAEFQGLESFAVGIPYGAAVWRVPFDPGDRRPYGLSFDSVLDEGDTIASIVRITMSSQAAALGVQIDQSTSPAPFIDSSGKRRLQMSFIVADGSQDLGSFDAAGVQLPVRATVLTINGHRVERSGVLTVRQL